MQDIVEYSPPRSDLNAPDLYIPVMSFVTYIIIIGVVAGLAKKNSFSPDVLGLTASKAFFLVLFEVLFVKLGNYFLNISSDAPFLELFAYMGYKFIPINTVLIAKIFSTSLVNTMVFIYCFFAFGFFTVHIYLTTVEITTRCHNTREWREHGQSSARLGKETKSGVSVHNSRSADLCFLDPCLI